MPSFVFLKRHTYKIIAQVVTVGEDMYLNVWEFLESGRDVPSGQVSTPPPPPPNGKSSCVVQLARVQRFKMVVDRRLNHNKFKI